MKKTLTVNLGGTVFHIDEDAYRLLDNYLSNLKIHFRKEAGADEIIDDIERRISELFTEKLAAGSQVITIAYVEEVIARMGKPEELEPDAGDAASGSGISCIRLQFLRLSHAGNHFFHIGNGNHLRTRSKLLRKKLGDTAFNIIDYLVCTGFLTEMYLQVA